MTESAYEIIGDILDAITLIFLYDVLIGKQYRVKKGLLFLIFIVVNISVDRLLGYFDNAYLIFVVWQIVFIGLGFLYCSKFYQKVIAAISYNVMGTVAELIVIGIFSFVGEDKHIMDEYCYVQFMISKLIVFVFIVVISLLYRKKSCLKDRKYKLIFLTSLLISIIEILIIVYIMAYATNKFIPQVGIVAIAVAVVNFILYIFIDGFSEMYEHKEREILLEKSIRIQEDNFEQLSNNYMQLRHILHDTNKHMKTIAGMIEENNDIQALEYIDSTLGEVNSTYKKVNTGNVVIDVMVSNLINQCEVYDIDCETEIAVDVNVLDIDNRDMTIILGNLIENAINYEKSLIKNKRKIDMAIIMEDEKLVIDINNACYDINAASKKDCGIENIERIVNKYSGTYDIIVEAETYKSIIILPFNTLNTTIQYK